MAGIFRLAAKDAGRRREEGGEGRGGKGRRRGRAGRGDRVGRRGREEEGRGRGSKVKTKMVNMALLPSCISLVMKTKHLLIDNPISKIMLDGST